MKDALKLLQKYRNGEASEKEKELLERWVHELNSNEPVYLSEKEHEEIKMRGRQVMRSILKKKQVFKLWVKISIAASIVLAVFVGQYVYQTSKKSAGKSIVSADINPGKVAATLTLSNGKKIYIADVKSGNVAEESGVKITKNQNGELVYTIVDSREDTSKMQTLTTYRGQTQTLVLPDGSKVWLNAASSIKYPSSFAAASKRRVELVGEAYFEITKDKSHPFTVATDKLEIEVLGTHFNVNSYKDEKDIRTTLLEGSVKVITNTSERIIHPGEQAINNENSDVIKIAKVDTEHIIDWKNNDFNFNGDNLEAAMRKVARWYNVEIVYSENLPKNINPGGWISRNNNISAVLKMIEASGLVHFKVEGRRILVHK